MGEEKSWEELGKMSQKYKEKSEAKKKEQKEKLKAMKERRKNNEKKVKEVQQNLKKIRAAAEKSFDADSLVLLDNTDLEQEIHSHSTFFFNPNGTITRDGAIQTFKNPRCSYLRFNFNEDSGEVTVTEYIHGVSAREEKVDKERIDGVEHSHYEGYLKNFIEKVLTK